MEDESPAEVPLAGWRYKNTQRIHEALISLAKTGPKQGTDTTASTYRDKTDKIDQQHRTIMTAITASSAISNFASSEVD